MHPEEKRRRHRARGILLLILPLVLVALWIGGQYLAEEVEQRFNRTGTGTRGDVPERAQALHTRALVVDLHADSLLWGRDLLERSAVGHVDLPRLLDGGVAVQVFGLVTQVPENMNFQRNADDGDRMTPLLVATGWPPATWTDRRARALHQMRRLDGLAGRSRHHDEGRFELIRSRADLDAVLAARREGQPVVGALLGLEGAHALVGGVGDLEVLFASGLRMLGLAHFVDNDFAGSAHGTDKGGLSDAGRRLVQRAEELGIAVDIAHLSPRALDDVLALAEKPLVVSHTGVRGTCDNPRNLSDAQLRAIARTGGVVGIAYFRGATCGDDVEAIARAVVHAVGVAGPDHVALGSDFDGGITAPFDTTGLPHLTAALLRQGLSASTVEKVLGANALRVLGETLPE